MKIFVTGGNGFIGTAVVRALTTAGHTVVCLLRESSRTDRIDAFPYRRAPGDVRDLESLRRGMAQCDATVHLAAPGAWEADDPAVLSAVVEQGTSNVLEAAAELRGHRVVVVSSTAAVAASDRPVVFDERAPFSVGDPALHYAHAKHRMERIAFAAHSRGSHVVIVNPAEVYGPGDTGLVTGGNLIDFATAKPVFICRGGTCIVHVDDVAAGIIAALERGRSGERYILGGENLSVRELAALVLRIVGRDAQLVELPNGVVRLIARVGAALRIPLPFNPHVVPYATRYWFADGTKARRELGVTFLGAEETIRSTVEWLAEAGHLAAGRVTEKSRSGAFE